MLTLILGPDWVANRDYVMNMITQDVALKQAGRVLIVPELISHDMERRLCQCAGDTSSRFAEVLSFTRLARRVSEACGRGIEECLDNGGRVVTMAAAARQLHSKLKAYASVQTRPEFLVSLVEAVDEFKRCCITSQDLLKASKETTGSFAQKLEELSLLLETYDALCARGKRDPRDQMTWTLEQLEDCTFAQDHIFYIDGFPDFTRQNLEIIKHFIKNSQQVYISLNCDYPGSKHLSFEKAGATAAEILKIVNEVGIQYKIFYVEPRVDALKELRLSLFQGYIPQLEQSQSLHVYQKDTVYEECLAAVEIIMNHVRFGGRFRDYSIVLGDLNQYSNTLSSVFSRCNIPLYQSGTEDVLSNIIISTVLSAIDAALGDFEQKDMLEYLKSNLSPVDIAASDEIENYVFIWNISGKRWTAPWINHPSGLGCEWDENSRSNLDKLNSLREQIIYPLNKLRTNFKNSTCLKDQVLSVYSFLEDICLAERVAQLADEMDRLGDNRSAQILNQLWDILLNSLEQMYDMLGETVWDEASFVRLLKLLLSQYDVGTIPPVLDAVIAGSTDTMRCQQSKNLLVLGMLEGSVPGYSGSKGVLSDIERTALRQMGIQLTGGALDGLQAEFADIYGVFCGAEDHIYVSCPAGQPSFLFKRLNKMAGAETHIDTSLSSAKTDAFEACAFLARIQDSNAAELLGLDSEYEKIESIRSHDFGQLSPENIEMLYGRQLNLSASQVDRQAECRLSYFLRYGLRVRERKVMTVDPAEFGTFVHAILEQTVKKVMELGGFHQVDLNQILQISKEYSQLYIQDRFSELDSQRISYLFQRNCQELDLVVEELWKEMQDSAFVPVAFELSFGKNDQMDAIKIQSERINAQLLGVVDRVDCWKQGTDSYFRVVDYKTGRKDFDYCDVFNGVGLQMLLYLFALEDQGQHIIGKDAIAAGVQYFPARAPVISVDGRMDESELAVQLQKSWKRKGLLLAEDAVIDAMNSGQEFSRLCCKRKKDGTITGDIADRSQFYMLKSYVFLLLTKLVDDITSGCVDPNPYTRGTSHNACTYCPYSSICHPECVSGRRNYKAMTAQRFWDEIRKEMNVSE